MACLFLSLAGFVFSNCMKGRARNIQLYFFTFIFLSVVLRYIFKHFCWQGIDYKMNMDMEATPSTEMLADSNSTSMDMNGHHVSMAGAMMMQMTFYFGVKNVPILFDAWTVNSSGGMAGACIAVCIVAMLYEGLKVLRETLLRRSMDYTRVTLGSGNGSGNTLVERRPATRQSMCAGSHWLQTFLHLVQVTVSYALMLIFMTYNGYLAISIIIGAALGYFIFGWKKAVIVDINEHCH